MLAFLLSCLHSIIQSRLGPRVCVLYEGLGIHSILYDLMLLCILTKHPISNCWLVLQCPKQGQQTFVSDTRQFIISRFWQIFKVSVLACYPLQFSVTDGYLMLLAWSRCMQLCKSLLVQDFMDFDNNYKHKTLGWSWLCKHTVAICSTFAVLELSSALWNRELKTLIRIPITQSESWAQSTQGKPCACLIALLIIKLKHIKIFKTCSTLSFMLLLEKESQGMQGWPCDVGRDAVSVGSRFTWVPRVAVSPGQVGIFVLIAKRSKWPRPRQMASWQLIFVDTVVWHMEFPSHVRSGQTCQTIQSDGSGCVFLRARCSDVWCAAFILMVVKDGEGSFAKLPSLRLERNCDTSQILTMCQGVVDSARCWARGCFLHVPQVRQAHGVTCLHSEDKYNSYSSLQRHPALGKWKLTNTRCVLY